MNADKNLVREDTGGGGFAQMMRRLYTGALMPAIGLGTFGSDHVSAEEIAGAVKGAAGVGYRHLDCASVHGNGCRIGVVREAGMKPGVNEMELHPHFQQPELFAYVRANGIEPIGYCPVGSPNRPERDRTPQDTVDIEDPVIVKIAERLGVHPAVVCVKWGVQRGQTPIPLSTKRRHYEANLRGAMGDPLTDEEMR